MLEKLGVHFDLTINKNNLPVSEQKVSHILTH